MIRLSDSVLGGCVLTPLCKAFLQTPEHYRLKFIAMSQADVLYPSVLYSRREHCIAVMELARRWAQKLTMDKRLIDLIALAGLYHDVGHVALSHTMDLFLQATSGLPDHEERSAKILGRVNARLGDLLSKREEEFVCRAIRGDGSEDRFYPEWCYQIVHQPNRSLPDVDRLVYLCHDTYKLGFPSRVNLDWILECVSIDGNGSLRFSTECETSLVYIVELREWMFTKVFQHPTVLNYQNFLLSRFCDLYGRDRLTGLFTNFGWLGLTDTLLWSVLATDTPTMNRLQSGSFSC
jgi:HD superfamily phosphohydrolase